MGPLISIITVSFNSEKTIERTLKSVAAQTYNCPLYTSDPSPEKRALETDQ